MKSFLQAADEQLITFYLEGQNRAFEVLLNRHKDRIYTSILILVKDQYLAEDLFQETFIKIIRSFKNGKYTEDGKFLPWALRITKNLCGDYFRRIKARPAITASNDKDIFELIGGMEETIEAKITRTEDASCILKLLNKLPLEQREVVVLRHFADLSFKEIASLCDCSINTALGRMRYALTNLRKMCQEQEELYLA